MHRRVVLAGAVAAAIAVAWSWSVDLPAERQHRIAETRLTGEPWVPRAPRLIGESWAPWGPRPRGAPAFDAVIVERSAIQTLEREVRLRPHDPKIWNDLAALRHQVGINDHDASLFADALGAVHRALAIRPDFPEARFNKGVILESLGIHAAALRAYESFRMLDDSSEWAREARKRSGALHGPASWGPEFYKTRDRMLKAGANAWVGASSIQRMVAESVIQEHLYGWAVAVKQHDAARTAEHLLIASVIAQRLQVFSDDTFFVDSIDVIEKSTDSENESLAAAYLSYRDHRPFLSDPGNAPALLTAEHAFVRAGSPMASALAHSRAAALFAAGDRDRAMAIWSNLLAQVPTTHHSMRWRLTSSIGDANYRIGRLHDALAFQRVSLAISRRAQDDRSIAGITLRIAETLAALGRRAEAWNMRVNAFEAVSRTDTWSLYPSLEAAARSEALTAHSANVAPLLSVATDLNQFRPMPRRNEVAGYANSVVWHALDALRQKRSVGSEMRETALRTGNRSLDPKVRIRARLDVLLIEAISLLQRHDAQAVVALLDTYIEEGVRNDYYDFFPEARFVRALAWRTDGYDDRAESDLRIALDMSSNRATEPPEQKSTYFRTAEEATTELVDILVRRGAVDNAFSTLGASRRHLCRPWDWQSTTPDPDIVIVEYLALRDRLLVFVATDTVTLHTVDVDDKTLRDTAIQFAHDVQASRESPAGRRLSRWLLDPIEDHLHQGRLLMIVPDRAITNVSFASLQTGDKYLIERVDLAFAPSSSLVVKPSAIQPGKMVAVGDPATLLNPSPLPYARKEAADVAQRYPDSELLLGRDATPERVLAGARQASVLHLATHAVVDQSYPLASYLALAPGEQSSGALTIDRIQWSALETAPLVVLAGCHTGAPPDGAPRVRTLALAFIAAGASNVVGTLWDLPDDPLSTEMSLRLHDELRRGVNPARALRTAQLSMLHSSDARRRDPAVWSAFQLWSAAPKRR